MQFYPFQPGYCAYCGTQTMVRDTTGKPVVGIIGSKIVWLCLCDDDGDVKTRVGTLTLCANCNENTVDTGQILENLYANAASGVRRDFYEIQTFTNRKIELVKTFGT